MIYKVIRYFRRRQLVKAVLREFPAWESQSPDEILNSYRDYWSAQFVTEQIYRNAHLIASQINGEPPADWQPMTRPRLYLRIISFQFDDKPKVHFIDRWIVNTSIAETSASVIWSKNEELDQKPSLTQEQAKKMIDTQIRETLLGALPENRMN